MRIVAIGEILWDVFADSERLGGASFNFAANARRLGHEVLFVSAVGGDERGRKALDRMRELGLSTKFVRQAVREATGTVTVKVDAHGQPDYVLHRPAAYDAIELNETDLRELAEFRPDWIYFGTLQQIDSRARSATARLIETLDSARRFYDVNLRKDSYSLELVVELLGEANVVKMNEDEMIVVGQFLGWPRLTVPEFCRKTIERFGWRAVCITRGERGCAILQDDEYVEVDGFRIEVADTVGAGDAFAAVFVHGLSLGWAPSVTGRMANRIGALVSSHQGALPEWTIGQEDGGA